MYGHKQMRAYQQQAVLTASPEELIAKLYDIGVTACHQNDRTKLRAVVVELMNALNHEEGGELAGHLQAVYEFALHQSAADELDEVVTLLDELRQAWRKGVLTPQLA